MYGGIELRQGLSVVQCSSKKHQDFYDYNYKYVIYEGFAGGAVALRIGVSGINKRKEKKRNQSL